MSTFDDTSRTEPHVARHAGTLDELDAHLVGCRACPRLVDWREQVGRERRAAFRDQTYWARPVPGFGDPRARVVVVGLAPAAHGSNRTGRMFTGDPSGDFLFAALHRTGFADRAVSSGRDDGMQLHGIRLTAPVRCAPPQNRPTSAEQERCAPYLTRELELLEPDLSVIITLGAIGWNATLRFLKASGRRVPRPRPPFAHGGELTLPGTDTGPALTLLGCYHVSPHNTYTGRLTAPMLDDVLNRARRIAQD